MKTLFISYSHDSEDHKAWVKKFADDLEELGDFQILLDQNLPKGFPLTRFMERGLANADKVLIIGTPQYKQKSETGKGVAFEGSIISTELMHDIDSVKYYPILRSGTFETSFPIVLQKRGGDDLSNDLDYSKKIHLIAESITNEKPIPSALMTDSNTRAISQKSIADVYFSQDIMLETLWGKPSGKIIGVVIHVQVTNLSKEIRYFNQPTFKVSVPIDGKADAFVMLNSIAPIVFPVKLEYGQQYDVSYKLVPSNIEMFSSLLNKDSNATIKAIVNTTLNERCESNSYKIADIVKNSKYVD